jgi:hypothetical protein
VTAPDQRFAGLLFDISKPEAPKKAEDPYVRERIIWKFQPTDRSKEAEDDLPLVPELGDVRTIQLVRKAIHVMRGGTAREISEAEMDNALAIFDRALAALLRRIAAQKEGM